MMAAVLCEKWKQKRERKKLLSRMTSKGFHPRAFEWPTIEKMNDSRHNRMKRERIFDKGTRWSHKKCHEHMKLMLRKNEMYCTLVSPIWNFTTITHNDGDFFFSSLVILCQLSTSNHLKDFSSLKSLAKVLWFKLNQICDLYW